MSLGEVGDFREPRAGHHDAGGVDEASVQSFDRRRVYGMSHTDVVGVNNQELRVAGEAELFRKRLAVDLCMRFEDNARKKKEEQDGDTISIHSLGCTAFPPLELDCESRCWFLNLQSSKIVPEVIVNLACKPLV